MFNSENIIIKTINNNKSHQYIFDYVEPMYSIIK